MDERNKLIEKLGQLSAKVYMLGRMYHNEEVIDLTKDINELIADAFGYSSWNTGTPKEEGLYAVLTKVSMEGVLSSEGTYILDYWDGYCFQYLKRKAMTYALAEPDAYGWVAWKKINLYQGEEKWTSLLKA